MQHAWMAGGNVEMADVWIPVLNATHLTIVETTLMKLTKNANQQVGYTLLQN